MDNVKVLLISTNKNINNKIEVVKLLLKNKRKFKIFLYTNKEVEEIKNVEKIYESTSKSELQNLALNNESGSVILLDLDYNEETIQNNLEKILENYNDFDIINFTNKSNKFALFFKALFYYFYNLILSLCNIQPLLNINSDFQYLSSNVMKVMSSISKSPNSIRNFDNFNGYNQVTYEIKKQKVKSKKNIKFAILALLLFVLAIISVVFTILLAVKFKASPNVAKMIFAECFIFSSLIIASFSAVVYHKYINKI